MKVPINYIKIKRKDKIEKCNICESHGKLSWDHVPPKGSIIYENVEIKSILSRNKLTCPKELSQNGTKFRTICTNCNNLLGSWYDTEFNTTIWELIEEVYAKFGEENSVEIMFRPVLFLKSLFGHLLAAKGNFENTLIDQEMRRFLLDKHEYKTSLKVFCWFHPYPSIEVARDISLVDFNSGDNSTLSILKMYPVGFYVTLENCRDTNGLHEITKNTTINVEGYSTMKINIDSARIKEPNWPIYIDNSRAILAGNSINSAVISTHRIKAK